MTQHETHAWNQINKQNARHERKHQAHLTIHANIQTDVFYMAAKHLNFFPICLHLMHIYQAPFLYFLLLTSRSSATSCNSSTGFSTLGLKTTNALPASTALKFDV